jgi:hypothetical protein
MSETHGDVLASYRAIAAKLKKRFMRKPNLPAAGAEFAALGTALKREGNLSYAAFAAMSAARLFAVCVGCALNKQRLMRPNRCDEAQRNLPGQAENTVLSGALRRNIAINLFDLRAP